MQTTLTREISFSEIGLHTGSKRRVVLKPAPADSGYLFKRIDLPKSPVIPGIWQNVVCTENRTVIGKDSVIINTVEHLLSALVGCGVDNCLIEVDGDEIPDLDGASLRFTLLIDEVGLSDSAKKKSVFEVVAPFIVERGDSFIACLPGDGFVVSACVDFGSREFCRFDSNQDDYRKTVAPAKTVASWDAVQSLWQKHLAQGGSFSRVGFVESQFDSFATKLGVNEVARHKVLDFMGDMALFGAKLQGSFFCYKAGHSLHLGFMKYLADFNCQIEKQDLNYNEYVIQKVKRIWV